MGNYRLPVSIDEMAAIAGLCAARQGNIPSDIFHVASPASATIVTEGNRNPFAGVRPRRVRSVFGMPLVLTYSALTRLLPNYAQLSPESAGLLRTEDSS